MAVLHLLPLTPPHVSLGVQATSAILLAATAACAYHAILVLLGRHPGPEPSAISLPDPKKSAGPDGSPLPASERGGGSSNRGRSRQREVESLGGVSRGSVRMCAFCAAAMTLFYYPLVNWSLQGSEVSAMALVSAAGSLLAFRILDTGRGFGPLYSLLAIALLLRADGFILYLAFLGFLVVADKPNRSRHFAYGLAVLVATMIAITAWREAYFGYLLPNTYYLKMTGYPEFPRIVCGLWKLAQFCLHSWLVVPGVLIAASPTMRDRRIALLIAVFLAQCVYSAFVGGDAWEWWGGANRYIAFVMPLYFVVAAITARYWLSRIAARATNASASRGPIAPARVAVVLLSLAGYVALDSDNLDKGAPLLLSPPPEIAANARNVEYAFAVNHLTGRDAKVAVVWAGTTPYFCERTYIDLLGKCDEHVAHGPMHLPSGAAIYTDFYPGHLKWDYGYSIGQLQPDLVLTVDNLHPDCAPYMQSYGVVQNDGLVIGIKQSAAPPTIY